MVSVLLVGLMSATSGQTNKILSELKVINISSRSILKKVEELEHIVLLHTPHVVAITTWRNSNIDESEVTAPNYAML